MKAAEKVLSLVQQCEEFTDGEPMQVKATSQHRLAGKVVRYVKDSENGMVVAYFGDGLVTDVPKSDLEKVPGALGNKA